MYEQPNPKKRKPDPARLALQHAAGMDKLPPVALELEEVILGALLFEKEAFHKVDEILKVGDPATGETSSFYKEAHELIYRAIVHMHDQHYPVDILTVTQYLRQQGQLDLVGGSFYITQLTNHVASAANIEYHARLVEEKHLQREAIRAAHDLINVSYDESEDVLKALWEWGATADRLKSSIQIKDSAINGNTKLIAEDKIMTFKGRKILSIGNLCALVAPPGTGKSQVCEALAASIVNPHVDCLGFQIDSLTTGDNGVLYVDTERSKNDCTRGFHRIQARAGSDLEGNSKMNKPNGDLVGLTYRSFVEIADKKMRRVRIENYLRNGGYRCLVLDGVTDLMRDPNDIGEAGDVVSWLIAMANMYNMGVFCTIHDNPVNGQTKPRGHIGSELYRKVEGMLLLRRNPEDRDMRHLTTEFDFGKVRNEKDTGMDNFFKWNDRAGMFLSEQFTPTSKTGQAMVLQHHFEQIFAENKGGLRKGDLSVQLATILGKSAGHAGKQIDDAMAAGIIELQQETKLFNLPGMFSAPF